MALLAYAYALAGSDRFEVVYEMLQELAVESGNNETFQENTFYLAEYILSTSNIHGKEQPSFTLCLLISLASADDPVYRLPD